MAKRGPPWAAHAGTPLSHAPGESLGALSLPERKAEAKQERRTVTHGMPQPEPEPEPEPEGEGPRAERKRAHKWMCATARLLVRSLQGMASDNFVGASPTDFQKCMACFPALIAICRGMPLCLA